MAGTTRAEENDALNTFRSDRRFVDKVHEEVTQATLHWLMAYGAPVPLAEAAKLAFVASSYTLFCSPPLASQRMIEISSKFLGMFFVVDDMDTEGVRDYQRCINEGVGEPHTPRSPIEQMHRDLIRDLANFEPSKSHFIETWFGTCSAIAKEREQTKDLRSTETLFHLRRDSVAVRPYTHIWYVMSGIELSADELEKTLRLRDLCVDQILLFNDFASLEKDRRVGSLEPNYAIVAAREGLVASIEEGVDRLVAIYNRQVGEIEVEREALLWADPSERMKEIVNLALMSVNGNIDGTRHLLGVRYWDMGFERFKLVSGPPSPRRGR